MKRKEAPSRKVLGKDAKTLTYKELSDKYGVSPATIGRWLKKYNLHRLKVNDGKNREEQGSVAKTAWQDAMEPGESRSAGTEDGSGKEDTDVNEDTALFNDALESLVFREYIMAGVQASVPDAPGADPEKIRNIVREKIKDISEKIECEDFTFYYMSMGRWYMLFHNADKKEVIEAMKSAAAYLKHDHMENIVFNVQNGANYSSAAALFNDVEAMLDYLSRTGGKALFGAWENASGDKNTDYDDTDGAVALEPDDSDEAEQLSAGIKIPDDVAAAVKENGVHPVQDVQAEPEPVVSDGPSAADDTAVSGNAADPGIPADGDTGDVDGDAQSDNDMIQTAAVPDHDELADGGTSEPMGNPCGKCVSAEEDTVSEVFLVDSENVSASWKHFIKGDPGRRIRVLYTDTTPKMSYSDINEILKHPEGISMEQVYPGEKGGSGLDFQLVTILGFLLCAHPDRNYYIVSRDKGYDPVVRYWRDRGYSVKQLAAVNRELPVGEKAFSMLSHEEQKKMTDDCTNAVVKKFRTAEPARQLVEEKDDAGKKLDRRIFLQKVIPGRKKNVYDKIMNILDTHNGSDFDHIHADFVDIFGGSQGERMYSLIKKKIKEYHSI